MDKAELYLNDIVSILIFSWGTLYVKFYDDFQRIDTEEELKNIATDLIVNGETMQEIGNYLMDLTREEAVEYLWEWANAEA